MPSANFGEDPSAGIFEKILSCETADAVSETLLEPLVDALGATSGVFMQIFSSPYGDRHFGARSYVGSKPTSVDVYVDGLYALDPVIRPVMDWLDDERGPAPSLLTGSFERDLEEDPQYRDTFLRPYDIGHVVAVAMPMRTGLETQLACVGFHRRHGDIAFLPEQLRGSSVSCRQSVRCFMRSLARRRWRFPKRSPSPRARPGPKWAS